MAFKPYGVITPVLTALDEHENFDAQAYGDFIDHLIKSGVHGIFALGTNGEFYAFSQEEKLEIIKTAVAAVDGRVPVYAGTGCVTTKETVELTKKVEALGGVDCLSVITPYFTALSQDDLFRHYKAVAECTSLPVLLYNIPAFIIRNSLCYVGYKMGTSVIQRAYESGMIQVLTRVASIVGLIMVGGMAASQISVPITLEFSLNGATQSIYEVFNSILPGMLELMLVLVLLRLIKKKVNVTVMIAAVFVIAIIGAFVGVF